MLRRLSCKTIMESTPRSPRLPVALRLSVLSAGLGLSILLVIAARLEPDRKGFGTHQQLGLPPCMILKLYNLRCPSCGMTTAWAHAIRGRFQSAVAANAGGTLLAIAAFFLAPWTIISGMRGRWLGGNPSPDVAMIFIVVVVGVTLLDWTVRFICG